MKESHHQAFSETHEHGVDHFRGCLDAQRTHCPIIAAKNSENMFPRGLL